MVCGKRYFWLTQVSSLVHIINWLGYHEIFFDMLRYQGWYKILLIGSSIISGTSYYMVGSGVMPDTYLIILPCVRFLRELSLFVIILSMLQVIISQNWWLRVLLYCWLGWCIYCLVSTMLVMCLPLYLSNLLMILSIYCDFVYWYCAYFFQV